MTGVWTSVWVTLAIQALASLVVFTPAVLAPAAQAEVGVHASAIGVATALIYLSATVSALLSGGTIGRHGPMRMSQASLALCGAGLVLMATANLFLIAAGALVIGLGYGQVTPSSSAILVERIPRHLRAFIFSLKQTGVPMGGALAGAVLPALILAVGWKAAALLCAGICIASAAALQSVRAEVDTGSETVEQTARAGALEPLRLVLSQPRLREMGLASFTYSGMQMCLGSFLVVFLHDHAHFGLGAAGAALSSAMIAGIGGRILWGVAADRWAKPRPLLGLLGVSMSAAAFATALVTAAWPAAVVFLVSAVYGATAVGWNGVYLSEVAHIAPPGRAAAATGASLALTYSGVTVLPSMFWAVIAVSGSYAAAFVATGLLTLWRGSLLLRRSG
ncbi:MAG TPA: MFS transporter [Burkholderiales bacterium]|nr:MFS transporter [Burkholderiales bacterium]